MFPFWGIPAMGGYMALVHVLSMQDEDNKRYPPEHWLERAQDARERALELIDPEAQGEMEMVARLYERLAEFARKLLAEAKI
jgi:hypothetical protein